MQIVIPLAGKGIRFKNKYKDPKPLIDVFGKPMIIRAIESFDKKYSFFFILKKNKYTSRIIQILTSEFKKSQFIVTETYTSGPASTVLLCENFIDMKKELIIANCDQYLRLDFKDFKKKQKRK